MTCRLFAAAILAILLPSSSSAAQDKAAYASALANFQKNNASKTASDRAEAVARLGDATYEAVDGQTVQLVCGILDKELKENNEEKISGEVLDACCNTLKKVQNPKAVEHLLKMAGNKGGAPRFRFYVISALGNSKVEKVHGDLLKWSDDRDPVIQIAAMDALAEGGNPKSLDQFVKVLADTARSWEVKLSALAGLDKTATAKDPKVVEPLMEALGKLANDEGRLKVELMRILNKLMELSGDKEIKSDDPNAWRTAWADVKVGKTPGQDGGTQVEPTEFFGLKSKSTRIVFVLDRTGSMQAPLVGAESPKEPPKGPAVGTGTDTKETDAERTARARCDELIRKYLDRPVKTRMDALKREFIRTIYNLDPRVFFTVVWYEANQQPWKDTLVPATWPNKLEIITETDKLNPSGGTNIWGGLEYAFKLVEKANNVVQQDKKGNYATGVNGADTFFLMTDGAHNTGKFLNAGAASSSDACDRKAFLDELRKVNRLRKVIINTVCLGDQAHDMDKPDDKLMKDIADLTGGSFVLIKG